MHKTFKGLIYEENELIYELATIKKKNSKLILYYFYNIFDLKF